MYNLSGLKSFTFCILYQVFLNQYKKLQSAIYSGSLTQIAVLKFQLLKSSPLYISQRHVNLEARVFEGLNFHYYLKLNNKGINFIPFTPKYTLVVSCNGQRNQFFFFKKKNRIRAVTVPCQQTEEMQSCLYELLISQIRSILEATQFLFISQQDVPASWILRN